MINQPVTAVEGTPFSGLVAVFSATGVSSPQSFSATIDWADGTTSIGVVTSDGGNFDVTGSHTFAEAGFYALRVIVRSLEWLDGHGKRRHHRDRPGGRPHRAHSRRYPCAQRNIRRTRVSAQPRRHPSGARQPERPEPLHDGRRHARRRRHHRRRCLGFAWGNNTTRQQHCLERADPSSRLRHSFDFDITLSGDASRAPRTARSATRSPSSFWRVT